MCLSEESAAVKKRPSSSPTRDPGRRRAADHRCGPGTFYNVWTIIGNFNVPTSLNGGGLYALRAGRCGCDSLSLAGSRQRVKSLRSSVRLRLGHILLAGSSPELTPASPPSNLPRARSKARQRPADTQSVLDFGLVVVHAQKVSLRDVFMSGHAIPSFARAFVFRLRGFRGAAGA